MPNTWYVRKTGSNSNGGSSSSATPDRSGSDGVATNATTTFTSVTASFTAGDVGKGLNIATNTVYRIAAYVNATTITLDRNYGGSTASGLAWAIGGAWLTVAKATNGSGTSTTAVQAGDTVYVGAGVYREVPSISPSYSGSALNLVGDTDGSKTGDAGEVQLTAWTTSDKAVPSSSTLLNFAGKNFWSWSNFVFIAGSGNPKILQTANSTDLTFTNCTFLANVAANTTGITHTLTSGGAKNLLFDKCIFFLQGGMQITLPTQASTDYDANIVYRNCIMDLIGASFTIQTSGALSNKGGGVYFYNCFMRIAQSSALTTSSANVSTTYPVKVENCVLMSGGAYGAFLSANTSGQITERNNLFIAATARSNVSAGTGSISDGSYHALYHLGQEQTWGGTPRPPYMPAAGSATLGFGSSGNGPTVDMTGQTRPAGGASASYAAGPYERHNTGRKETSVTKTGATSVAIVGPGCQTFSMPVDSSSTTITCWVRWTSGYTGTKPTMTVINGTECGVADQTVTATGSADTWEQLSATITPSAKGIVDLRIGSNDGSGSATVYLDTFGVS